jgi:Bacterial conjugation TrbI-like protein
MQGAILIAGLIVVFYVISSLRGGGTTQRSVVNMGQTTNRNGQVSATFTGIETDRPAVMQAVFEQNRRDMAELRSKIESDFSIRDKALQDAITQNQELQRQMQQMMGDFTTELKSIQVERARDNERLAQLADQQRQLELNAPVNGVGAVTGGIAPQRRAIQQVVLGGGNGVMGAVRAPFAQAGTSANQQTTNGQAVRDPAEKAAEERLPFIPPLGFVRATLLNGVDALVGGSTTPALARLSGTYKTAMNSTISLDGCIAMVEFSGNISTERATGKPARMTCVYPDGGAATYSLSGYAVDAEDGIIGIPGVLYEGDPSRIAAAMLAEFAAGVAGIVEDNTGESVTTVNNEGTTSTVQLPSSADWAEQIIGGSGKVMGSLRDYLQKRADRVQSFIRLDTTREINLVILNGTELRKSGEVWSALFDGNSDSGLPQSNLPAAAASESSQ